MRYVSSDYPEIQLARLFWETNADIRYLSSDYPICQSILIDHYRLTQYPICQSILRDHCLNYVCFNMSDVYHLRIQKATKSNLPSLSYTFEISDTCYPSLAQSISTNVYILQSEYIVLLGSKFHPCLKSILLLTCAAGLPTCILWITEPFLEGFIKAWEGAIVHKWNVVVCFALLQQTRRFAMCWNW